MNTAREPNRTTGRRSGQKLESRRKPLKSQVLGGYWRVPVFALIGAMLAFSVSFIFKSQYSAVARLIIHPNDSSYAATDSGAQVAGTVNIGGIDITKQTTLGNTLVNLATSNEAAESIVKEVGVDTINGTSNAPELGMTSKIMNFLKVGGTGTAPTKEQAAINHVRGALEVEVLEESWVMEITAWDPDPKVAGLIATTAAKVAVQQSEQRFRENSVRELEYLNKQLETSKADLAARAQAVTDFEATLTTPEAEAAGALQLAQMQSDLAEAGESAKVLEERQAAVAAIVDKPRFDASQLGPVVVANAPGRPLRYLFLLVGALVGALAGLLLTWFRSIREEEAEEDGSESVDSGQDEPGRPDVRFDEVVDLRVAAEKPATNGFPVVDPPVYQGDAVVGTGGWNSAIGDRAIGDVAVPAAEVVLPAPEVVLPAPEVVVPVPGVGAGRGGVDDATLTPSEAGSIAAALFGGGVGDRTEVRVEQLIDVRDPMPTANATGRTGAGLFDRPGATPLSG